MALSPDILKEHFNQVKKCKVEWIVTKLENIKEDSCSSQFLIYIKWKNNNYFMRWEFPKKWCIIDSFNKLFFDWNINIWNKINYILDENYNPLEFDNSIVNISKIPYCTWNIIKETKTEINKPIIENNYLQNYYWYWIILILVLIIWVLVIKLIKAKK